MPDRSIIVPALYVDTDDATLELDTPDHGESGTLTLRVGDTIIARGEGFRAPLFGASLLEQSDERQAGMFGRFLDHALTSSEDGVRSGWSILTDDASDWVDALTLMELDA